MYKFKDQQLVKKYNMSEIARIVGITPYTINNIVLGKQSCTKRTAYCITKAMNENAEIEDYFIINK